ncbi:MAG: hypothetical protein PHS44_05925 [Candidatus Dojkabacteria bacterium]|nr:hypothetical protein [Candidatus Dojkabacteria bacterium]
MKEKKDFTIVGILVVIIMGAGFGLSYYLGKREQKQQETQVAAEENKAWADAELAKIPGSENFTKIALVGKEYIFEDDIQAYFARQGNLNDFEDVKKKEDAIELEVSKSLILQEANTLGWIKLDSSCFNNPKKDYEQRGKLVVQVQLKFEEDYQGSFEYEANSIVFNPTLRKTEYIEEYGLEAAKSLALQKLESIRERVVSGEVNIKEAGEIIENDSDVQMLNPDGYDLTSVSSGAYFTEVVSPELTSTSRFSDIYEELEDLNTGDTSKIYLVKSNHNINGQTEDQDTFYVYYHIVNSGRGGYSNLNDWIQGLKSRYNIIYY